MVTVFLAPDSKLNYGLLKAKQWATDKGDPLPECKIANYLNPGAKVIAGSVSVSMYSYFHYI